MDPDVLLQLAMDEDWTYELALLATLLEDDASRVFDKAFDLAIFTVSECVDFFRFSPPNILLLCHLLGMPGTMIASVVCPPPCSSCSLAALTLPRSHRVSASKVLQQIECIILFLTNVNYLYYLHFHVLLLSGHSNLFRKRSLSTLPL